MDEFEGLPAGKYFFVTNSVRPSYGGLTRSIFNRSDLFYKVGGVASSVLTFDLFPYYDDVRSVWESEGVITDGVELLNIHEYYRTVIIDGSRTTDIELPEELTDPIDCTWLIDRTPGGKPWRSRAVHRESGKMLMTDYLRDDGSVYMRALPASGGSEWSGPRRKVALFNNLGELSILHAGHKEWFAAWISELSRGERSFIITDVQDPELHLLITGENFFNFGFAHGPHTNYPRMWNSSLTNLWSGVENRLSEYDGIVALTDWQKQDLEARWGNRNNFFAVPHALSNYSGSGSPVVRHPHKAVTFARLSREKRIDDAVRAFALVVKEFPDAVLDIFGDGPERESLDALIRSLELSDHVFLRGHSATAKESSLDASAFLMTSRYEGQSMAILEAQARGCPVVAYDVKYGPRACITHDETGFLVEEGNVLAFAERICSLFRDSVMVSKMSEASVLHSLVYDDAGFVDRWKNVLKFCIVNREGRIQIIDSSFMLESYTVSLGASDKLSDAIFSAPYIALKGSLLIEGTYLTGYPIGLDVSLRVVDSESGIYIDKALDCDVVFGENIGLDIIIGKNDIDQFSSSSDGVLKLEIRVVGSNDGVSVVPVVGKLPGATVVAGVNSEGLLMLQKLTV